VIVNCKTNGLQLLKCLGLNFVLYFCVECRVASREHTEQNSREENERERLNFNPKPVVETVLRVRNTKGCL